MRVAPAAMRRRVASLEIVDLERHADVAGDAPANLHFVDIGRVQRVRDFQCRPTGIEDRHVAAGHREGRDFT